MSKIDLSKAKFGDKFRTRGGLVFTYYKEYINRGVHILKKEGGMTTLFLENGNYMVGGDMHPLDLVEQVFDDEKGRAIADKILKDVETVVNGVVKAKPLIESATIANLLREQLPENNEDDSELHRRQEVVVLAEKLFTEKYLQEWYQYLIDNNTAKTDYVTYIFECSEKFVNAKDKYLKEGKL